MRSARFWATFLILLVLFIMSISRLPKSAAQSGEPAKLFVQVDPAKADLTPAQEEALARIKGSKTAAETQLVRVRTNLLVPSPLRVKVNIGGGKDFQVMTTETKPLADSLTWIGKPVSPSDIAVLVVRNGNVTGTVRSGNELYSVRPLGGGLHALVREDQTKFPPEHPPNFEEREKTTPPNLPNVNTSDLSPAPKVLRVLVAYTPRVAAARPDILPFIDVAINETNTGYERSGVNLRAELAHAYQVDYQESDSQDQDLEKFRGANDSVMDEVHELRNTYKADVCVLLIDNDSYCGTAAAIMADESTAFAVVHYACAVGYYSFGHEIGHLQGARHNQEADPTLMPFSYGHGYQNSIAQFRTIMSYNCPSGCPRILNWANPSVNYNGVPTGSEPYANDARVLNETAPIVTAFRN